MVNIKHRRRRCLSASPSSAALIVPMEARQRRRRRRSSTGSIDDLYGDPDDDHESEEDSTSEPTSPRVSCVGRIEIKRRKCKAAAKKKKKFGEDRWRMKKKGKLMEEVDETEMGPRSKESDKGKGKAAAAALGLCHDEKWLSSGGETSAAPVPSLEKMRRFSSCRRPLTDFVWEEEEEKGVVDGSGGGISGNYSGG